MKKIFNIKVYFKNFNYYYEGLDVRYNKDYNYKFNENKGLNGQIVLNEDGWFEGLIKCNDSLNKRFTFGFLKPGDNIELYMFSPNSFVEPIKIYCHNSNNDYLGEILKSSFKNTREVAGIAKIELQALDEIRTVVKEEIEDLESRLAFHQLYEINEVDREIYNEYFNRLTNREDKEQTLIRK